MAKVVVNVAQIFHGDGAACKRYRRGDLVDIGNAKMPKWGLSIAAAEKKFSKKEKPDPEPKTLSEMSKKNGGGKQKVFGQDVDQD